MPAGRRSFHASEQAKTRTKCGSSVEGKTRDAVEELTT